MERTLVILKPDSVKRKLIGEIISRFEKKNFTITHMKMMTIDEETASLHYSHVKGEPFFNDLIKYMTSGPVVAIILSGNKVISTVRNMIGKTSSFDSLPGTIRGDYGSHDFENLIHASDSVESAEQEIKRFFPELTY
ncbi:nucleoside-diphosphate kinase [Acetivibrio saccincola]|uniref:Nucleoside diphosphate kinase n=1 Tax=Acetivibrio saccincola TaxID=1677857 RepID=A0A2K9ELT7_9FIRM|nr:nucleoside-diphosphate kinase [Acetivibrio saccincola]AUG57551.1 Nucleoside diphosphate kinase [Acetivibrio saccincola]NLW26048.1 nucleoside-diphosphate kinase [Acetivibrio saccincola]PQQ67461.1 nucleoside-diphosphate kinase [Acetivibrio saccincola]HOA97755.1 nucleoside-diphosphate kinase [Acetivibrio saccincola]HQD29262.1 nucleoside-diphosphate kinase [Acetivibrio saccincola]